MTDNDKPVDCRRCNRDNAEQNSSRHSYHDDHRTGEQEQKNDETTEVNKMAIATTLSRITSSSKSVGIIVVKLDDNRRTLHQMLDSYSLIKENNRDGISRSFDDIETNTRDVSKIHLEYKYWPYK